MIVSGVSDIYHLANQRAILAYLRSQGGEAEIHAQQFGMKPGEFSAALYRLKSNRRIRLVGKSRWEVVE